MWTIAEAVSHSGEKGELVQCASCDYPVQHKVLERNVRIPESIPSRCNDTDADFPRNIME